MKDFINKEQFKTHLKSGMSIMVGGFLANGSPDYLIDLILETDFKDFTIICNDAGLSEAISQENLESPPVNEAIDGCPVGAITIDEKKET